MTVLSARQARFVEQRRSLNRRWWIVGWILLAAIAAVLGYLFWASPMLVAPWEVAARLQTDSVPLSTLQITALMLPLTILGCFLLLVAVVAFQFAAAANERRLLEVIDVLQREHQGG
jgi:hypothetical protein